MQALLPVVHCAESPCPHVACLWAGLSAAASVVSGCFPVELFFEKQSIGLLGEATSAVYMTWGADVTN